MEDRSKAYKKIRAEYSKKLEELTEINKAQIDSQKKKMDQMSEKMRAYQAELQTKALQENEIKKLQALVSTHEKRITDLTDQIKDLEETNGLLETTFAQSAQQRELIVSNNNKEIEAIIECVTGISRMVSKGEKVTLLYLRERVKDEVLKKMKPFLEINKVKL